MKISPLSMELFFYLIIILFKITTAQSSLKYLAILNLFLSTPGLAAKLMLMIELIH